MGIGLQGFLIILGVGVVIMTIAALADRRSRLRLEAATRPATLPAPEGHPEPDFVTADELQAKAGALITLGESEAADLAAALADDTTQTFDLGLLAPVLATHEGERAIITDGVVVVCAEAITSLREVLPVLQRAAGRHALVLAAPGFDDGTEQTLIANHLARKLTIVALVGDDAALADFAAATRATPVPRTTLQADDVTEADEGRAANLVATTDQTWLITPRT